MNKHETLYSLKNMFENKLKENKIFQLSFSDAALVTFEKVGVFYKLSVIENQDGLQKYLKTKINTNQSNVEVVNYIQESLKWMFRWYSKYCINESVINTSDIKAEDVYDLMGIAFSYEKFHIMWDLFSGKKVKYIIEKGNKLIFDYNNEEVYKNHVMYDSLLRKINTGKSLYDLHNSQVNKNNYLETINYIHQSQFSIEFEVEFDGFNLEEYKIFSNAINFIFAQKLLNTIRNMTINIIPGEEGVILHTSKEWVDKLSTGSGLTKDKTSKMIKFFTYDLNDEKSDISLAYFIPYKDNTLIVSEAIFNLSSPQANALRLLCKKNEKNYSRAQNNFEEQQIQDIKIEIGKKYLIPDNISKGLKNRPGMDLIVYDKETNHLQVVELKYKIPIESTSDIKNLDNTMLNKAYQQVEESKSIVSDKLHCILYEYYGEKYKNVVPQKIDHFILTNYSIGTGIDPNLELNLPTPILLISHYIECMKEDNGMELVHYFLNEKDKGMNVKITKRYARYKFINKKILIPEYFTKIN